MHFHIPLALKLQFSMRTTEEKKNKPYAAYINYIISLPVMFSTGLCIITSKCNEIEKGKREWTSGKFSNS